MCVTTYNSWYVIPLFEDTHFVYYRTLPDVIDSETKVKGIREGERREVMG
jgi:hypothetical protein